MRQLITILLALLPIISFGQLTTSTAMSPAGLVQNVLLGSGVTVSNISFNGVPTTIGSFDGSNTNLGIDEGIVITTGTVYNNGSGPHGPNNNGGSGIDNSAPGYGLLSNLIGGVSTHDAAILEFDFIPYSDSVEFKYVFGSEEYPEWVGSTFNDVFAFFISGPGISGGIQNIAQVPFGGGPVTINNVNDGSNSAYYVNNGNGSQAPYNGSDIFIQYDGFTQVMTAESAVQCGETYHLIICIADAGDGILDSGIFLEANSLSSNVILEIEYSQSANLFGDESIIGEGCVNSDFILERDLNLSSDSLVVSITPTGTAIEGVDYSMLPDSVIFPPGVGVVQFSFFAFMDALVEGIETIIIEFGMYDACGDYSPIIIELSIQDLEPIQVVIESDTMICPGDAINLYAVVTGGAPPFTYIWNTSETTQTINVSPTVNTTYSVTATDGCLTGSDDDSIEIIIPIIDPVIASASNDITEICPYVPHQLESSAIGGSGIYTYQWFSNFDPDVGNTQNITVTPSETTLYTIVIEDYCGDADTVDILYTITSPPLLLTMSPGVEICPGDSTYISVVATGGYGDYYYNWIHSGETTDGVWVTPGQTTTYEVSVSDECQTFTVEGYTEIVVSAPTADFTSSSTTFFNDFPITFINQSQDAVTYEWDFGDGNTDTFIHPTNIYDEPGMYYVTLVAIDWKGCTDTIVKPINIEEEWFVYVPNTFTPDGDRHNNDFRAVTIGIKSMSVGIYNRWGEVAFTSNEVDFIWDGTYDGAYAPDGTFTYIIDFITNSGREKTIKGHVNVLR